MTNVIQLNPTTGNPETTNFLSATVRRRDNCVRDIIRDGSGRIIQVRWFADSSRTTELYRKEITWGATIPTQVKHIDYLAALQRCKNLVKGATLQIDTNLCTQSSFLWGLSSVEWESQALAWS